VLDKKLKELPTDEEVNEFILLLETSENIELDDQDKRKMAPFGVVQEALEKSSERVRALLQPGTLFGRSAADIDERGRLSTDIIIHYLMAKAFLLQQRIALAKQDIDCTGYLNPEQLQNYFMHEVIPFIEPLRKLKVDFRDRYLKVVMMMFAFFLDHKNLGKIRIADILVSGFVENIFHLQDSDSYGEAAIAESWFGPEKTQELLSTFQMYDEGAKNYLVKKDFSRVDEGGFTSAFVDRLFDTHVSHRGENMFFSEFVAFMIARDHMSHPAALKYFFKIFDINNTGRVGLTEMKFFYKDLKVAYEDYLSQEGIMPKFEDFANEMFDMARPKNSTFITLDDLVRCKQGFDFMVCQFNFMEYYRYDNREGEGQQSADDDSVMPQDDENLLDEAMIDDEEQQEDEREAPTSSVSI